MKKLLSIMLGLGLLLSTVPSSFAQGGSARKHKKGKKGGGHKGSSSTRGGPAK